MTSGEVKDLRFNAARTLAVLSIRLKIVVF